MIIIIIIIIIIISIRKYLSNIPGKHEINELPKQPCWALDAYFGN